MPKRRNLMADSGQIRRKEIENKRTSSNSSKGKGSDAKQDRKSLADVQSFSITVPYIWR